MKFCIQVIINSSPNPEAREDIFDTNGYVIKKEAKENRRKEMTNNNTVNLFLRNIK